MEKKEEGTLNDEGITTEEKQAVFQEIAEQDIDDQHDETTADTVKEQEEIIDKEPKDVEGESVEVGHSHLKN